jgi:competence protein ComEC
MKDFPLVKYTICFVIGILLTSVIQIESTILLTIFGLVILLLFLSMLLFKNKYAFVNNLLAFILIVLCSFFITQIRTESFNSSLIKYHKEKDVLVYGKADNIELRRDSEIVFTVITDSIHIAGTTIKQSERILCKFRGDSLRREELYSKLLPGNSIYVEGIFLKGREQRNPGEFDYNKYLNSKGIPGILICNEDDSLKILSNEVNVFDAWIFNARKMIDSRIHQIFNSETSGLLRGLILADRSEIDFELKTQFINSGVIHVLAVSGLHVGYILIIFIFLFGRFNIYLRTILVAAGLLAFMFITGVPPSVFRATVMAIIILIAFITNRSTNLINSIAFAAITLLLVDPHEIYNPGFQLSFSAVLSIAIIYPIIERQINSLKISGRIIKSLLLFIGVSLSAQIGTLPFTLAYFGKLSVVSIFANLIVIPLIGVVIALAFTSLFVSIFSFLFASYFAAINELIVSFLFLVVSYTGNFQYSFIWISDYSLIDSIIFYSIMAAFLYAIKDSIKWRGKIVLTILVLANIVFLSELDDQQLLPDNKLSITDD